MGSYRRGCATFSRQFFCSASFSTNRRLSATNKLLYAGILNPGRKNGLGPKNHPESPLYSKYASAAQMSGVSKPSLTASTTGIEASGDEDASDMNGEATSNGIRQNAKDKEGTFKGYPLKGTEHGFKYEKHEPTMFGDWTHMGRVTDF
ncbi:hypothetical protein BEWA_032760 [Theileria equi strain WA]|uniref:Uncharacterized protein n=1 Tax=Theileria equi strain WA TaxID=1537102 RepID=L0AYW9_THEEQ|nr:hypothetical protein BEWA_032760 [Theileria equi strain WA]AFZ80423.1 hypothetical protein BEWA_032760 [Theileria equi strain WA]|eukprot:XP_004830089.1 hypothetical protein BEWA_032760 [Theileria equi strain WA]